MGLGSNSRLISILGALIVLLSHLGYSWEENVHINVIQDSVQSWLRDIKLEEYTELFHREGYEYAEDIINLKELDVAQLKAMGITKRGIQIAIATVELITPNKAHNRT